MTLPLLFKGLNRIEKASESNSKTELRQFLIKAAIKLLTDTETDRPAVFKTLLTLCNSDLKKLECIFTYGKLSGQPDLKALYLDPMSEESKSTLAWLVTNIKLTKAPLGKNELRDLETKSNDLSRSTLNRLSKHVEGDDTEFAERVFVYAKYVIIKHMASQNKHDIAIEYCRKVNFEHNRNWQVQRMVLEKLAKSGVSLPKVL